MQQTAPTDSAPDVAGRRSRRSLLTVGAIALLVLLPFLGKAFHVDDPLFLWAARQVTAHPLDPYGLDGNWDGHTQRFFEFMQNPPGVAYYLAVAAGVVGWGEVGLHAAMVPVGVAAVVGTYLLAAEFCRRPAVAALLLVACPGFLVSATTLMSETPLLCLWVWAVLLWVRGSAADRPGRAWPYLLGAGALAAAATLAKYPGINLLPLLVAYAVLCPARRASRPAQVVALLLPVVILVGYDRATAGLYGYGLLSDAILYSRSATAHNPVPLAGRLLDGLCFLGGGGLAAAAVAAVRLGRRAWLAVPTAVVLGLAAARSFSVPTVWATAGSAWGYDAQCGLLAAAGVGVAAACVSGRAGRGDPADRRRGWFLLAWVGGVFAFAAFLNWSVNIRSVLPLLPAACILAVRATDRDADVPRRWPTSYRAAAAASAVVALLVAAADDRFADDNRTAAAQLTARLRPAAVSGGHRPTVWFGGHWGFQWYMERGGAKPLDADHPTYVPGDLVVLPLDNYGTRPMSAPLTTVDQLQIGDGPWLSTMDLAAGAGFYFSPGDRLPFVFGPVPPEAFRIERVGPADQSH